MRYLLDDPQTRSYSNESISGLSLLVGWAARSLVRLVNNITSIIRRSVWENPHMEASTPTSQKPLQIKIIDPVSF